MTTGMMIYLLICICRLIGLALVVLALMSLIENWFKQRTKGNGNVQAGGDVWKDKQ